MPHSYVNSLALLLDDKEHLIQFIRSRRYELDESANIVRIQRIMQRLSTKRLYLFSVDRLLSLAEPGDREAWGQLFQQLGDETRQREVFLVPDNLAPPLGWQIHERHTYSKLSLGFFFATRGVSLLSLVAPLSWPDYVQHIENGRMAAIIRHWQPFLLNPRPSSLSQTPIHIQRLAPDHLFVF